MEQLDDSATWTDGNVTLLGKVFKGHIVNFRTPQFDDDKLGVNWHLC